MAKVYDESDPRMFEQGVLEKEGHGDVRRRFPHYIVANVNGWHLLLDLDLIILAIMREGDCIGIEAPILYRGGSTPSPIFPVLTTGRLLSGYDDALRAYAKMFNLWPEIRRRILASDYCRAPLETWVDVSGGCWR